MLRFAPAVIAAFDVNLLAIAVARESVAYQSHDTVPQSRCGDHFLAQIVDKRALWLFTGCALAHHDYEAAAAAKASLQTNRDDSFRTLFWLGSAAYQLGDLEQARVAWRDVGAAQQLLMAGRELVEQRRWGEALAMLSDAQALSPGNVEVAVSLAQVQLDGHHNLEAAQAALESALAVQPSGSGATQLRFELGSLYEQAGQFEQALAIYQEGLASDPDNYSLRVLVGRMLYKTNRDATGAIAWLQQAVALEPKQAQAYHEIGAIYRAEQHYDEALSWFRKAAEADPNSVWPWAAQAETLLEVGRLDESITLLNETAVRFPAEPHLYYLLANVHRLRGEPENALIAAKKAVSLDQSGNLGYLLTLAGAYEAQANWNEAYEEYLQVLARDPNRAEALAGVERVRSLLSPSREELEDGNR